MEYKDYYKVMGVTKDASDKDIKNAYRRLARKYHPDLNKEANAEENFKALGEAYEVLRDKEKRKTYDQYMRDVELNQQRGGFTDSRGHSDAGHDAFSDFQGSEDFFEFLFGQRGGFREPPSQNRDLHSNITVTLEEAFHGAVKDLQFQSPSTQLNTLRVKIPAGVKSGQKIRLAGQGIDAGNKKGDLYLTVDIAKHPIFDVKENDIYVTLPVTPWEVALGSTVQVPTLAGKVDLKIPAGAQGGQTLRLKHRGLKGKESGDQYVILKIVTPKAITDKEKALYKTMSQEMPFNPRANMGV